MLCDIGLVKDIDENLKDFISKMCVYLFVIRIESLKIVSFSFVLIVLKC